MPEPKDFAPAAATGFRDGGGSALLIAFASLANERHADGSAAVPVALHCQVNCFKSSIPSVRSSAATSATTPSKPALPKSLCSSSSKLSPSA